MFLLAPHLVFGVAVLSVGLVSRSPALTLGLRLLYMLGLHTSYRRGRSMGRHMESILAILAAAASLAYTQIGGRHYVYALRYWLALMLVFRAFRRMEKRDYAFCLLISAGLYADIGGAYNEWPFLIITIANLTLAPYALFHFLAAYGGFHKTTGEPPGATPRFSTRQVKSMSLISALLVVLTILFFLIIPRPRRGSTLGGSMQSENADVRLSGEVALGSFKRIRERRDIVMTVETDTPRLWRGTALDYYE